MGKKHHFLPKSIDFFCSGDFRKIVKFWLFTRHDSSFKFYILNPDMRLIDTQKNLLKNKEIKWSAHFSRTYAKIGTIQRLITWPLCKGDTQTVKCSIFLLSFRYKEEI